MSHGQGKPQNGQGKVREFCEGSWLDTLNITFVSTCIDLFSFNSIDTISVQTKNFIALVKISFLYLEISIVPDPTFPPQC